MHRWAASPAPTECVWKQDLDLSIRLPTRTPERTTKINLECRIIHIQKNGIGFQFLSIDFEGYHTFKRMMVLNSEDPERLLLELKKHPGLIVENSEVHHE